MVKTGKMRENHSRMMTKNISCYILIIVALLTLACSRSKKDYEYTYDKSFIQRVDSLIKTHEKELNQIVLLVGKIAGKNLILSKKHSGNSTYTIYMSDSSKSYNCDSLKLCDVSQEDSLILLSIISTVEVIKVSHLVHISNSEEIELSFYNIGTIIHNPFLSEKCSKSLSPKCSWYQLRYDWYKSNPNWRNTNSE
jgi:hypothetical protein